MVKKNFFGLILGAFLSLTQVVQGNVRALYNSLEPNSITQLLAFYEVYPDSSEGNQALQKAWSLLSHAHNKLNSLPLNTGVSQLSSELIEGVISLINRNHFFSPQLKSEELQFIEELANTLANRSLKGYKAQSEKQVLGLKPDEIDLGRGLLLSQLGNDAVSLEQIRSYEAMLDLMALQILARLPQEASCEDKIREMNYLIFDQMHFRFPPQSQYAKDIDLYTFLPSVLDQHLGVCLGVTTLYLALAQRIDLPLEVITPPGHIYVRYRKQDKKEINIETTARGIDVPSETYLGVNTRSLELRNLKEVIGMTHVNQASVYLHQKKYDKAIASYEKAFPYMPNDPLVTELLGYSYLLNGEEQKAMPFLKASAEVIPSHAISRETMTEDFLLGKVDKEGIEAVIMAVDERRESILEKLKCLQNILAKYPEFRAGRFSLAVTWLQLNRRKEALEVLSEYHSQYPHDATAEYYLAVLHMKSLHFSQAWKHLKNAENITLSREFMPKALVELRRKLNLFCPET